MFTLPASVRIYVAVGRTRLAIDVLKQYLAEGEQGRRVILFSPWLRPLHAPGQSAQTFAAVILNQDSASTR